MLLQSSLATAEAEQSPPAGGEADAKQFPPLRSGGGIGWGSLEAAKELHRDPAPEARQGVAVDANYFYAVSNWTIAKYDKRSGERVAIWEGDKRHFPHINSCTVIELESTQLVCANSNFPGVPHWSRFAPMSSSGGGWGPDGRLYVTGHDHPELYILELPAVGAVLEHVGTISVPIEGQAIDWDESAPGELYGISRKGRAIVRMHLRE